MKSQANVMKIKIKRLPSGYYHIRGEGVCNWAQVERWPCTIEELEIGNFMRCEEFIDSVMELSSAPKEENSNE